MPAIARLGDVCTGHSCFPSRPNAQASSNVFVCGVPAHRLGDAWQSHCCPGDGCHGAITARTSGTVFVNGLGLARVGDALSCGSTIATGCGTCRAGD